MPSSPRRARAPLSSTAAAPAPAPAGDAMRMLASWVADALAAGLPQPSTMTFATSGPDGPHARTVLVTAIDAESLRFHTSAPTTKTTDLAADDRAAAVFHWPALGRQAILVGRAAELPHADSRDGYLAQPRRLQVLAWVYEALLPTMTGPDQEVPAGAVERTFAAYAADPVSAAAPDSWTTIALTPHRADFWAAGAVDRPATKTRYTRSPGGAWRSFHVLP